ncbi:ABC transporter permease [Limnohabitans radicicola]|uniref:ABC transporter permease n=1 Tax=Limnohabitans radicicola TaxID=2771427 RepID=A0A927FJF0_9BURK|nr:ABC transporter permease [Limnohabitans radicicola]MBD8051162.1 ABC transporter permease [Limnohabitans radicicola]
MVSNRHSNSLWAQVVERFRSDKTGMGALTVVGLFFALVLSAQLGWVGSDWQEEIGQPFAPPHVMGAKADVQAEQEAQAPVKQLDISDIDPLAPFYEKWQQKASGVTIHNQIKQDTLPWGGDRIGRDVLKKAIKGAQISILVGLTAALMATLIGTVLGAVGGYFGGAVDDALEWLYNVFNAIPYVLLIFALAAVFKSGPLAKVFSNGIMNVVVILSLVGWTGIYRLVRAEYIKHRSRDYVRAAEAIGASHFSRLFVHILPNISHVILVQLSLHVVGFIKAEVILSFLGLGVSIDMVSWGTMLSESQTELILGIWWQFLAATTMMAIFVTAFALFTDALRDALDPKIR